MSDQELSGCLCLDNGVQKVGPTGEICPVCEEQFKYLVLEEDTRTEWDHHMENELLKLKKKTNEIIEQSNAILEHMLVVQKNEEEEKLERAKKREEERKEKEAKERKFYSEFQFTRKEYLHRVDQMYSEEYFGDVEMTKTSSLPKFRSKNKPISSKERIRRALKKEKDAAKEANWITTASSFY